MASRGTNVGIAVACSIVVAFVVLTIIVFTLNKNTQQQLTKLYLKAGSATSSIIRDPAITNPASW